MSCPDCIHSRSMLTAVMEELEEERAMRADLDAQLHTIRIAYAELTRMAYRRGERAVLP